MTAGLELQHAIHIAIGSASPPIALIYDSVPPGAALPYVTFGPSSEMPEEIEGCAPAVEVWQQLDVWSAAPGRVEAMNLAGCVRALLDGADLDLASCVLVQLRCDAMRVISEPENGITHIVLGFTAVIEEQASAG